MAGEREKRPVRDEVAAQRFARSRRKRVRLLAVAFLVMVTLVFAIWSVVFILTSDKEATRLAFLTRGSVGQTQTVSLAFLGEGQEMMAPGSGILLPLVEEGDRVARDVKIALLVSPDRGDQIQRYGELKEAYYARLFVVSGFADLARHPQALSPADSRLREALTALAGAADSGEMAGALQAFDFLFPRSRAEAALFVGQDAQLDQLASEIEALRALFESDAGTIVLRAPLTGLVSFVVPPFPSHYEAIKEDPPRHMEALASQAYQPKDSRYQMVQAGGIVASVQRFSGRSLVAFLPVQQAEDLDLRRGSKINLLREVDGLDWQACELTSLDRLEAGYLLKLSYEDWSGYQPGSLAFQDVQLQLADQKGLRLPLTSLMDLDLDRGKARLMKVTGGVTTGLEVRILASDGRYAIIEAVEGAGRPLSESDLYVVNPWTTEEGQLID
ncbi:MAG TPA: hypothetical protein VFD14_00700 [Clostridia bacterium]|nr:hypothetical protein [Clostridia bacterium]